MTSLPDSWDDEPWPLDEPDITYGRPVNWSDTHESPPQVVDLADEAWEYAVDHGVSMEQALVRLQDRAMYADRIDQAMLYGSGGFQNLTGILNTGGVVKYAATVPVSQSLLDDWIVNRIAYRNTDPKLYVQWTADPGEDDVPDMADVWDKVAGDQALDDINASILPASTWQACIEPEDQP